MSANLTRFDDAVARCAYRTARFLEQRPNEGAPVMAGEPLKARRIACDLLVFDQTRGAPGRTRPAGHRSKRRTDIDF
jgi:hypothetical protein